MKRRRRKKKKRAGRRRSITTPDIDTAAIWKTVTARTGFTRPHRSPLSHLCDSLSSMHGGPRHKTPITLQESIQILRSFLTRTVFLELAAHSASSLCALHLHFAVNHSTPLVARKQQLLGLSGRPVKLPSWCNWAKELEVTMITDSLAVCATLPLFFT